MSPAPHHPRRRRHRPVTNRPQPLGHHHAHRRKRRRRTLPLVGLRDPWVARPGFRLRRRDHSRCPLVLVQLTRRIRGPARDRAACRTVLIPSRGLGAPGRHRQRHHRPTGACSSRRAFRRAAGSPIPVAGKASRPPQRRTPSVTHPLTRRPPNPTVRGWGSDRTTYATGRCSQRQAVQAAVTTKSDPQAVLPRDLVKRQFTVLGPRRLWVADVTPVATWSGFAHVAFVTDADSRTIAGWKVASTLNADVVPLWALGILSFVGAAADGESCPWRDAASSRPRTFLLLGRTVPDRQRFPVRGPFRSHVVPRPHGMPGRCAAAEAGLSASVLSYAAEIKRPGLVPKNI